MRGYILVQADPRANGHQLAHQIVQIPGVDEAEHVVGGFDVIARVGGTVPNGKVLAMIGDLAGVLRALPLPLIGAAALDDLQPLRRAG